MASIILPAAVSALSIANPVLGAVAMAAASATGAVIDQQVLRSLSPAQKVVGPRLGDRPQPTADYGVPIARLAGVARLSCPMIWIGDQGGPAGLREERHQQTKDGVKRVWYEYYATWGVLIGRGPIAGVARIWFNGQLVYDARPGQSAEVGEASDLLAAQMSLHLGTEDQPVDPLIESFEGGGDTPAYRGWAYLVFDDIPVTASYGNRIPEVQVEAVKDGSSGDGRGGLPVSAEPTPLHALVGGILADTGLPAEMIDVSALTAPVHGYARAAVTSARELVEELQLAYGFDLLEVDGVLRALPRARSRIYGRAGAAGLAVDAGGDLYLASRLQRTLSRHGDATLARRALIGEAGVEDYLGTLPAGPRRVAFEPVSGHLFVTCWLDARVARIDPASGSVVAILDLDSYPDDIVVAPGAKLEAGAHSVVGADPGGQRFDIPGNLTAAFPAGQRFRVAGNSAGNDGDYTTAASSYLSGSDKTRLFTVEPLPASGGGGSLTRLLAGGNHLWVSHPLGDRLSHIDPADNSVTTVALPGAPSFLALDGDGDLWVSCTAELVRFDPESETEVLRVDLKAQQLGFPGGLAYNPADDKVWFAVSGNDVVGIVERATGALSWRNAGTWPFDADSHPADPEHLIWVSTLFGGQVQVFRRDPADNGLDKLAVLDATSWAGHLLALPDGRAWVANPTQRFAEEMVL